MREAIALLVSVLVLPVGYVAVIADQWGGLTRYPGFDIIVLAVATAIGVGSSLISRRRLYLFVPAGIAVLLLVLMSVDLSPVKPAMRAVEAIRPGMTEAQVRSILEAAFPFNGRFRRPEFGELRGGRLSFCLDPNDPRYNAASVDIRFRDGRCEGAKFEPD